MPRRHARRVAWASGGCGSAWAGGVGGRAAWAGGWAVGRRGRLRKRARLGDKVFATIVLASEPKAGRLRARRARTSLTCCVEQWSSVRRWQGALADIAEVGWEQRTCARMHVAQTDLPLRRGSRNSVRTRGRSTSRVAHANHSECGMPCDTAAAAAAASAGGGAIARLRRARSQSGAAQWTPRQRSMPPWREGGIGPRPRDRRGRAREPVAAGAAVVIGGGKRKRVPLKPAGKFERSTPNCASQVGSGGSGCCLPTASTITNVASICRGSCAPNGSRTTSTGLAVASVVTRQACDCVRSHAPIGVSPAGSTAVRTRRSATGTACIAADRPSSHAWPLAKRGHGVPTKSQRAARAASRWRARPLRWLGTDHSCAISCSSAAIGAASWVTQA